MKNKTIAAFVLAYVLLGSVYSVTPTFADNHITIIESTLNDSKERIDEKFAEFVEDGLAKPPTALSLYNEGLVKYLEALNFLGLPEPDFVNANASGLEALSFFGDAYQILKSEEELVVEPEGYVGDILAIAESITALKDESTRLSALIDINYLSIISLEELDALITSADTNFTQENFAEALTLIESAEAVLNDILKQIEYKAEEEQAERVSKYVKDLVGDLEDLISTASEAGLDASVISQFQYLVDTLNNYESPSDVFDITGESSQHKDALDDVDDKTYKGKIEAELVDADEEDGGEAKFKQRGDRTELSVKIEDQEPGAVFTVHVNGGDSVGEITIKDNGDGKLKLKSKDGDTVPSLINEDGEIIAPGLIEIKDVDGVVVLSGTFSPEEEYEEEYEIEVEVKKGKAKIKIELDDEKYRFVLTGNPTDADIISAIVEKTGLDPSFITSIWDYEVEEEDEDVSSKIMHEHEGKAMQTALDLIYELQQRIEQLEDRIQTLLEKYESGEYFGTVPEVDSEIKSYTISFDGSATSIDDESIVDVEGEIFLENLLTFGDNISKFRVTGGEISIDKTFYDIVFGKARVSSSGPSGENDSLVLLAQVIDFADEDDDSSTLKLVINSETSLEGDFGLDPISIEILPQSKIAGQWYLSGSGQLSLLEG